MCEDGGDEALTSDCNPGTDCSDCGVRVRGEGSCESTPIEPPVDGSLVVQYRTSIAGETTSIIQVHIRVANRGRSCVPLSTLTARYWYTPQVASPQAFELYYAAVGEAAIAHAFGSGYAEVGFTSGTPSIAPGTDSGEIQFAIHNEDWTPLTQIDDYSFDASTSKLADWERITLYHQGTPVWGSEP